MRASSGVSGLAYSLRRTLCKAALALALVLPMSAAAETITLAAMGDSLTQGYGLPQADGLVPRLEAWLRQRGHDVAVINAGVSGDTTAGGLARIGWTLTPEVRGLIVELGANDMLRGIDPAASRANLRGVLEAARGAGVPVLLVGIEAPTNYGPDYKAAFNSIYPDLAAEFGTLLMADLFAGLGVNGDPAAAMDWLQADGLHPNARGVARMVDVLGPQVEVLLERID